MKRLSEGHRPIEKLPPFPALVAAALDELEPLSFCSDCGLAFDGEAKVCGLCLAEAWSLALSEDWWRYEDEREKLDRALYEADYNPAWNHEVNLRRERLAKWTKGHRWGN